MKLSVSSYVHIGLHKTQSPRDLLILPGDSAAHHTVIPEPRSSGYGMERFPERACANN